MEGWTEDEIRNKELRAPCGIFCGACAIYIATRNDSEKFRTIISSVLGTKPEETISLNNCGTRMKFVKTQPAFGFLALFAEA